MSTNKWHFINSFNGYVDFEKELLSIPDEGATSVDIRLTFNTESHTCYYFIALRNDIDFPITWEREHELPWDVGIAMLGDEVPLLKELLSCPYCGGDCSSNHDYACDGFLGNIDNLLSSAHE